MKSAALQDSICLPQVEMKIDKSALGHQLEALFSGDPEGNRSRATYALGQGAGKPSTGRFSDTHPFDSPR